jgi:hypothetical protein
MFIRLLFLIYLTYAKQIRNLDTPACRNCIHYKASLFHDYSNSFNKCQYFGKKDLITNEINYDYADSCRNDENKCGEKGKYFEEDQLVELKVVLHNMVFSPYSIILILTFLTTYIQIIEMNKK